ncbi:transglutaminase-like domain-containing protein [Pedobacter miscanthi]|uniref:transglutaminase-like domain-containing protein n=1 Tax=Pedobacter miscanthi TaxID=2259170 RepID=UPI00292F53F0|nr:transglutaminase-like domain-containing protein [Pedobacter miscanthi]
MKISEFDLMHAPLKTDIKVFLKMKIIFKTSQLRWLTLITIIFLQCCKRKDNIRKDNVDFDQLIKQYSANEKDSLKLQCLIFLKNNIEGVTSEEPYFYNDKGGNEDFKLDTITSDSSLRSILKNKKINFSFSITKDADCLSSKLLEENIDKAISDWKKYPWNKNVPKDVFLNYLLPYKVLNENPDNWRANFFQKYKDSITRHETNGDNDSEKLYSGLRTEAWSWLKYTGDFTRLTRSPSYKELVAVRKGQCYELSHLFVFIARSAGIPATIDLVPLWGKTSGSHAAEVFYGPIKKNNTIVKYGLRPWDPFKFPPKVFRMSFKRTNLWSDSIKPIIKNRNYFIPAFLKSDRLLDVTAEYTSTLNFVYQFEKHQAIPIAYICVYSYGQWKPIFYGKVYSKGKYVKFNGMAKDMAYHIAVPNGSSYKLIGKPFIIDSLDHVVYSEPNLQKKISIVLEKTNIGADSWVKKNRAYTLKYLDKNNHWKDLGSKLCQKDSSLSFSNVPINAFYMLEDKMSNKHLSRTFLHKNQKQIWY